MKKMKHTLAFRVNDTTITHITLESSATICIVVRMARRRLEKQGYTVNELVWNTIEDAE